MTRNDFIKIKDWFKLYTAQFHSNDENFQKNIDLKIEHSYRVWKFAAELISKIEVPDNDKLIAETAGILHDIGRFKQFEKYGTFSDKKSVNHAQLSVEVIKEKELITHLSDNEQDKILTAVFNHNKKIIPGDLSKKESLLVKVLRDADKLDILRIVTDYYCNEDKNSNNALQLDLPDTPSINSLNYKDILNERIVDLNNLETLNDFKLLQIGWIYDLNFKHTFKILKEKGYLEVIFDTLPDTKEIKEIKEKVSHYMSEKLIEKDNL